MVLNVFALADKTVRDCMVPREKMAALDVNTPPDKVLEVARLGAHTRMPVYDGNSDNIVGIVNTKDLFFLFSTSGAVVLEDALYPATFLDPDEPVANALPAVPQVAPADGRGAATRAASCSVSSRWKTCSKKSSAISKTSTMFPCRN